MRFHLTDSGDPGLCQAKQGRCPFGGANDHYGSAEEARISYEASQSMTDLFSKAMMNNPKTRAMQEQVERNEQTRKRLAREYATSPEVEEEFQDAPVEELKTYNDVYAAYEALLTEEEKEALYEYSGITYDPVNKFLRDPESFVANVRPDNKLIMPLVERTVENLDSALAKAPRTPRRLFRRLDQESIGDLISSEDWAASMNFEAGQTLRFKSYSSTTVNPGYIARTLQHDPHTSIVLILDTDEGAPVGPTVYDRDRTHTQEGEAEILVPRNSSFRVSRVQRVGYASEHYDRVEVLTVFLEKA